MLFRSGRTGFVSSSQEIAASFPTGAHIGGNHHSVMVVHDHAETALHYVFYYPGKFSTTSSMTQNPVTRLWADDASITLKNGRTFGYRRESANPNELRVNGTAYDLRQGRVFVLQDDGTVVQRPLIAPIATAKQPEALAKLLSETAAAISAFGPIIERTLNDPNETLKDSLISLDSGTLRTLPAAFKGALEVGSPPDKALMDWLSLPDQIVDAAARVTIADGKVTQFGLRTFHLLTVPIEADLADKLTPDQVLAKLREKSLAWSFTGQINDLMTDGKKPAAFVFQSRSGLNGILQILGFSDNPRGVKIRFKVVQEKSKATTPSTAQRNESPLTSDILAPDNSPRPLPKPNSAAARRRRRTFRPATCASSATAYSRRRPARKDRKSTRLNSSHVSESRMPSSA